MCKIGDIILLEQHSFIIMSDEYGQVKDVYHLI